MLFPLLLGFHGFVFLPPNPRTPPSSPSGFDFAADFSGICPALIPPAFDWRRRYGSVMARPGFIGPVFVSVESEKCMRTLWAVATMWPQKFCETEKMMFEAILEGKLDLRSSPWPFISASAKDLIVKMLQMDPRKRITSAEALCKTSMAEGSG
ncbi:Tyrosine-protein kinase [Trema orientale]|uniref:Tyrosine-protein kinase n=1 Tax=Trema orientale TaxID=63057 RepID=A0A2P5F870_TREOI|nr:Tyrosine-protein kinase [Trema orientale]